MRFGAPRRAWARFLLALLVAGSLSGCMWVASPRCLFDRSEGEPLLGLRLMKGRTMMEQPRTSVWEAALFIELYSDGYLHSSNLRYPWCRQLPLDRMQAIEAELDALRPLTRFEDPVRELARRDDHQSAFVDVMFLDSRGQSPTDPVPSLSWSPLMEDPAGRAEVLDGLLCAVEAAMGSGFHNHVNQHFRDLLAARVREAACRD